MYPFNRNKASSLYRFFFFWKSISVAILQTKDSFQVFFDNLQHNRIMSSMLIIYRTNRGWNGYKVVWTTDLAGRLLVPTPKMVLMREFLASYDLLIQWTLENPSEFFEWRLCSIEGPIRVSLLINQIIIEHQIFYRRTTDWGNFPQCLRNNRGQPKTGVSWQSSALKKLGELIK